MKPLMCAISLLIISLLATSQLHAADTASLDFIYSYTCFDGPDSLTDVEFTYLYGEDGLTYRDGMGRLQIHLELRDSNGVPQESFLWMVDHSVDDGPSGRVFGGMQRFQTKPGEYTAELTVSDALRPRKQRVARFPMYVRSFPEHVPALSDIELITEMAPAGDEAHPFQRGEYILVRNVSGTVSSPGLLLKAYVEFSNTREIPSHELGLTWLLADTAGRAFFRQDTLLDNPESGEDFAVISKSLKHLPSDIYILGVRLFYGRQQFAADSVETIRTFRLVNNRIDTVIAEVNSDSFDEGLIDPYYSGMSEEELVREYEKASYIMSPTRKNIWKMLEGEDAKARFLTRFWMALDDDPSTPENEFREDYYSRVDLASKLYYSPNSPDGWDSDRGRILLTYGKPDNVDRHPNETNLKPYEIWTYRSSSMLFVFVDRSQTGNYVLVHTSGNVTGEIRNPNWKMDDAVIYKQFELQRQADPYNTEP